MDSKRGNTIEQDHALIDRITYIASLASESKVIDPMLDSLRKITSAWKGDEPLENPDRTQLSNLESDIKEFLITRDPLRSFTSEDLEDHIRLREAKKSFINKYLIAALASFVFAGFIYFIPSRLSMEHKNLIAASIQLVAAQLITVWFYVSNLKNFKKEFRQAFVLVSVGILPLGIFFAQIGFVQLIGIGNAIQFQYAEMSYIATLAFIIMYLGFRKYALLLEVKSKFSSLLNVAGLSAVAAVAAVLLPHPSKPQSELFFDISVASIMVLLVLAIINAVLIHKIMRLVTSAYRKPILIIYIYMYAAIFGAVVADLALYLLGELSPGSLTLVIMIVAMPQQLLLLYSGYLFDKHIGR